MVYGVVAAFGLHFVAGFLINHSAWLRLVGGVLMIGIGVYELLKPPTEKGRRKQFTVDRVAGWYGSTFVLTITNPITTLSFGAVFVVAGAVVPKGDLVAAWTLIGGVLSGSALWFTSLAGFSKLFHHAIDVQGLRLVSRVSGVLVIAFGVVLLLSLTDLARHLFGY
jgi:arginine exporter protein ArgO